MTTIKYMDIDSKGKPVKRERELTAEEEGELQERTNKQRVEERARQALQENRNYVNDPRLTALLDAEAGTLSTAQRDRAIQELVRQSVALTRQVNGLGRLLTGQLDDVD